jgi:hypothetical protein
MPFAIERSHDAVAPRSAQGIRISKLERRALDDAALRLGCSMIEPYSCCDPCWRRWVCARIMEHLRGERCWEQLDMGDFGLLRQRWHANLDLVEYVVGRIAAGAETLDVLGWAVDTGQELDDVAAIIRTFSFNARGLPRFAWLSWAPPCGDA